MQIEALHDFLTEYTQAEGRLQPEIANYLKGHFLAEPLRDWDVSRPAPYFGFEIPDAPGTTGTCGSTRPSATWARPRSGARRPDRASTIGGASDDTEIVHFIGKDIVVLPHAVLAGHAEGRRVSAARSACTCTAS